MSEQGSYNTTMLAADFAKAHNLSRSAALKMLETVFTLVGNAVARGNVARIHSFGNFKPLKTSERVGRNPQTGEETIIPASTRPHFTAAQHLKHKVKDGKEDSLEQPAAPVAAPAAPKTQKPKVGKGSGAPKGKPSPNKVPDVSAAEPEIEGIDEL